MRSGSSNRYTFIYVKVNSTHSMANTNACGGIENWKKTTMAKGNAECTQYRTRLSPFSYIYMKTYHASLYAFSRLNGFGADESHNACKNRSSVVDVAANARTKIVEIHVHWVFVINVRKGTTEIKEMHVAFATITTFIAQPSTFCCPPAGVA